MPEEARTLMQRIEADGFAIVERVLDDETVLQLAREIEPFNCLVQRGGVLAMRPLLVHASSKSRSDAPRRVLHIEYTDSMEAEHGLELAVA